MVGDAQENRQGSDSEPLSAGLIFPLSFVI